MSLDSNPITTASLAKPYHLNPNLFERAYKEHISGFKDWSEAEHAEDWLVFPEDVIAAIERIDSSLRDKAVEITMDFPDTMEAIAVKCFPQAKIIIDRFHAQKLACDAMQEIRMEEKRAAAKTEAELKKVFKKRKEQQLKRRKKNKKDNRGRKPSRSNEAYTPF